MYEHKEYRTLKAFARLSAGFGWVIVALFFVIGYGIGSDQGNALTGLLLGLFAGFVFGIGFIVYGQMVSVFLDQKEILESMLERLPPTSREA